ncbi:MAG: undecaprenyl-diphosphate phosphatase, partial [Halobacteria archaeon]|nr:undecaprenyl-diphosphate phosphatase [Halobacteria archaeon]
GVAYTTLKGLASEVAGGTLVAIIGVLLVGTGVVQRVAKEVDWQKRDMPDGIDAFIVGALQGTAILPGVSRSGTTVSALLLRGHDGESSLRLSFLLSIPASFG